jgi:ATP-dependent Clp protease ATP-binding subunit ClpC
MFERYTESARKVLFLARYEASQRGNISIETEHILLGLIRDDNEATRAIFARSQLSVEALQKDIESRAVRQEKLALSVEIFFSGQTKRILEYAASEPTGFGPTTSTLSICCWGVCARRVPSLHPSSSRTECT